MSYPDIDLVLNLKSAVKDALKEYLLYQKIIIQNKANLNLSIGLPIVGKLREEKLSFSHRGGSGAEEAKNHLKIIDKIGDDPKTLIQTIVELLELTRKSKYSKDRHSRYGCIVYHVCSALFRSKTFYSKNSNNQFKKFIDNEKNTMKSWFIGDIKQQNTLVDDSRVVAYLSGCRLSYFNEEPTKSSKTRYIDLHKYGDEIKNYLIELRNITPNDTQYEYKYGDSSRESMRLYFDSQIKALQARDPLSFCIVYLLSNLSGINGKPDKTAMQMIRKILGIPKDFLHTDDWIKILKEVHWLKPKGTPDRIQDLPIVPKNNTKLPQSKNHNYIKELNNQLADSLLDIHDGVAGVLLSGSMSYLADMGYDQEFFSVGAKNSVSFGVGLSNSAAAKKTSLISKYTFGFIDVGIQPFDGRKNGVFSVHGVSGLEKALEIKSFAEQEIQLRSRYIDGIDLEELCHLRLQHIINCFYQICYSLLDDSCHSIKYNPILQDNVTDLKKNIKSKKIYRSSLLTYIMYSFLIFFEKEQITLFNAKQLLANKGKKYNVPYIDLEKSREYLQKLSTQYRGVNDNSLIKSDDTLDLRIDKTRAQLCMSILQKSYPI